MHRFVPALLVSAVFLSPAPALAQEAHPLDTLDSQFSYMIGRNVAESFRDEGLVELDLDAFLQAFKDVRDGTPHRMDNDAQNAAYVGVQERAGEKKLTDNVVFLERNGTRDDVTVTDSGLQYMVTQAGSGDSPTADQTVTVHYEGRLLDGTVFDSSIARGEPATFPVGGVIRGWQEVLQLMAPGAEWEVWIPSVLAYGPQGAGRSIGPNEVLNFTIELISIEG